MFYIVCFYKYFYNVPSLISNGVQVTSTHVSECFSLSAQTASIIQSWTLRLLLLLFLLLLRFYPPTKNSGHVQVITEHTDIYTHSQSPANTQTYSYTHNQTYESEKDWWDWHSVYPSGVLKYVGWIDAKRIPVFNTHWKYTGCQKCI